MKCYNHYHHLCYHSNDYKWSLMRLLHQKLSWRVFNASAPLVLRKDGHKQPTKYVQCVTSYQVFSELSALFRLPTVTIFLLLLHPRWLLYANSHVGFLVCVGGKWLIQTSCQCKDEVLGMSQYCNEGEVNLCGWVITEVLHIRPLVPNRKSVPTKSLHRRKGSFEVSWSMAFFIKKRLRSLKIPP